VILLNDDYTPREFVVTVLKAEFRMIAERANRGMITAHKRGACVVGVFAKDVAETKATRVTEAGRRKGYPLLFATEPEELDIALLTSQSARYRARFGGPAIPADFEGTSYEVRSRWRGEGRIQP